MKTTLWIICLVMAVFLCLLLLERGKYQYDMKALQAREDSLYEALKENKAVIDSLTKAIAIQDSEIAQKEHDTIYVYQKAAAMRASLLSVSDDSAYGFLWAKNHRISR